MSRRIAAVAERVGVSEATVSRVLNGRDGVAPHTRELVLTALDALGYERPTQLRGDRARLVGLVVPDLANPAYAVLSDELGSLLNDQGLATLLCPSHNRGGGLSERDCVTLLLAHHVSGIVFLGGAYQGTSADHSIYQPLLERHMPTVFMNACAADVPAPRVATDDWVAGRLAYQHLRALGHQRIGLLMGEEGHLPSLRKLEGCREEASSAGEGIPDEWVLRTHYSIGSGQAQAAGLWSGGVTAIIAVSDMLAVGAVRAAERQGLSVPSDVSVIGFDDSPLMAHTGPPLTTIRAPFRDLARAATDALVDQLSGRPAPASEQRYDPELVVRHSTGPATR